MSRYLTKADFLAGITLKPVDFEVDGLGTVQVRGLSIAESTAINDRCGEDNIKKGMEAVVVGMCNPQLSLDDVQALYDGDPRKVSALAVRISELSGSGDEKAQGPLAGNGSSE